MHESGIRSLNARTVLFSISLGMSFGILVLFVGSLSAISLVVVLITASIVVSSTVDLTAIKEERNLPLTMVATAIIVFVSATMLASSSDVYLFYQLFALNIGILVTYIAMRIASRNVRRFQTR